MRGPVTQAMKGLSQSVPVQLRVPKLPQSTPEVTPVAFRLASVSAVPALAGPADSGTVGGVPAVNAALPLTTANRSEPSGQVFLATTCTLEIDAVTPEP